MGAAVATVAVELLASRELPARSRTLWTSRPLLHFFCTRLQASRQYRRMVRKGLMYAGAGTAAVLGGFLAWRFLKGSEQQREGGGERAASGGGGGAAAAAGGAE